MIKRKYQKIQPIRSYVNDYIIPLKRNNLVLANIYEFYAPERFGIKFKLNGQPITKPDVKQIIFCATIIEPKRRKDTKSLNTRWWGLQEILVNYLEYSNVWRAYENFSALEIGRIREDIMLENESTPIFVSDKFLHEFFKYMNRDRKADARQLQENITIKLKRIAAFEKWMSNVDVIFSVPIAPIVRPIEAKPPIEIKPIIEIKQPIKSPSCVDSDTKAVFTVSQIEEIVKNTMANALKSYQKVIPDPFGTAKVDNEDLSMAAVAKMLGRKKYDHRNFMEYCRGKGILRAGDVMATSRYRRKGFRVKSTQILNGRYVVNEDGLVLDDVMCIPQEARVAHCNRKENCPFKDKLCNGQDCIKYQVRGPNKKL